MDDWEMRSLSLNRQRKKRQADKLRADFRKRFPSCWVCSLPADDIHEIARGGSRAKSYAEECNWLRLCRTCHEEMSNYDKWTIVKQIALQGLRNSAAYDREKVNILRGRHPDAIMEQEVMQHMRVVVCWITGELL